MCAYGVGFDDDNPEKGKKIMKKDKLNFAVWLRAFGVLLILACHFTQQSGNAYLIMSAQFFNIGNNVFFILSGFLFGIKSRTEFQQILPWYKKRLLRIYLPYELMLIVLFIADFLVLKRIDFGQWIPQLLGVHAWNGVFGATQTWFVTSILICYLLTPLVAKCCYEVQDNKKAYLSFLIFLVCMPAIVPYTFSGIVVDASIITPIFWYSIAFWVGNSYEKIPLQKRYTVLAFVLMSCGFAIRLLCRTAINDTILYNYIVVGYTHAFGAFCIFYIFAVCFEKIRPWKIVTCFAGISFEVYLWHYMFTEGPLRLFGITGYWVVDCGVVFVISIIMAFGANRIAGRILPKLR